MSNASLQSRIRALEEEEERAILEAKLAKLEANKQARLLASMDEEEYRFYHHREAAKKLAASKVRDIPEHNRHGFI